MLLETVTQMTETLEQLQEEVQHLKGMVGSIPKCCASGGHHPFWQAATILEAPSDTGFEVGSSVSERLEQLTTTRALMAMRQGGYGRRPRRDTRAVRSRPY